jgi:hypothetical protein
MFPEIFEFVFRRTQVGISHLDSHYAHVMRPNSEDYGSSNFWIHVYSCSSWNIYFGLTLYKDLESKFRSLWILKR